MSRASPAMRLLRGCWATLGLPFADEPLDERRDGLVDPEALLVSTLLLPEAFDARVAENVRAWCGVYEHVIHYQRLGALVARLPETHRGAALGAAQRAGLHLATRRLEASLGAGASGLRTKRGPDARRGRIRAPAGTSELSAFIRNRLFFGTGYRADLVTITSTAGRAFGGAELSRLLAATPSTVSRILSDLKGCGFLDRRGRQSAPEAIYPGFAISADSPTNLVMLLDARQMRDARLVAAVAGECDFEWDRLGAALAEN